MRINRRIAEVLLCVLIAAVTLGGLMLAERDAALASGGEVQELDPSLYAAVQELRRELALTNRDLAVMGCDQAQAEQVLTTVKDWCVANATELESVRAGQRRARAQLRAVKRRMNVGPSWTVAMQDLSSARDEVSEARLRTAQSLDEAADAVALHLDLGQRNSWESARSNLGGSGRYRFVPDLSDQQSAELDSAWRTRGRLSVSVEAVEQHVLTSAQRSALQDAAQRVRQHMPAVLAAEAAVLPRPRSEDTQSQ